LRRIALFLFFSVLGLFLLFVIIFPIFATNLPSPDKIVRREGFSTKILDRNGKLIYDIFADQKRVPVKIADVPLYLRQATVAIEDKNFYKHQGFDPLGILRAVYNIVVHHQLQGGSTLTQQLVKNVLLSSEKTIVRKIKEFILTVQIERKYTKDEILQMYLNEAPYGGTAWGIEAAAETYFGKKVGELDLAESAILAGLPQRPSYYSPFGADPKAYINRTNDVLRRMREDGYISIDQEEAAKKEVENMKFASLSSDLKAGHFTMYVQQLLEERYGERLVEQGGLKVTTTLDLDLQEKAQQIVAEEIGKVEKVNITNGAAVVIDVRTGEILAMVGSKNFSDKNYDGQFNVVTQGLRQPGSAIKPVTYVTALKKGYTAATMLMDVKTTFPGGVGQPDYTPVNYDGKFRGPLQVRYALGNSINMVAVKMLALVGVKDMLSTAFDMGIKTLEPTQANLSRLGLSVTLGGGEVRLLDITTAYAAFGNGGMRVEPTAILKVEDNNGKVLEEIKPQPVRRVITPQQAFIISNILSDNNARLEVFGPNSALNIAGRNIAVKTGTTNDKRDNWTIGWSPNQVIVGVWVGNNNFSPMKEVASGITGAAPIWRKIILEALKDKPTTAFDVPEDIVTSAVDVISGYPAHDGFPSRIEYFIKGTEPSGPDPIHTKLKICKSEGKLATPSDIASGNYEEKEYFVFKEEDPSGLPNRWQEGILNWISTQSDPRYHPPTEYCGSNPIFLDFISPKDLDVVASSFTIKINADSTSDISSIDLELDGENIKTFNSPPYEFNVENLSDGPHSLKAIVKDSSGNQTSKSISISVNLPWATPTPSPTPTLSPTPALSPAPTL